MEIVESETQQPNLGLATTRELLQELAARFDLEALRPYPAKDPHAGVALIRVSMLLQRLTPKTLDYRTVEGD